ncbi:MAG: hypothetical protein ACI4IW_06200 [Oscillospiraceae bacterium]
MEKAEFSPRTKKIVTTVAVTLAVCLFFVWLGAGMYVSVPEEERGGLLPMFLMYAVFPLLIALFGAKRIYIIANGGEDPDPSVTEQQSDTAEQDEEAEDS